MTPDAWLFFGLFGAVAVLLFIATVLEIWDDGGRP